jgi:hypothetical protein
MALQYYNRYKGFLFNGEQTVVPYVRLTSKSTDKRYTYRVGRTRLDKVSQQIYNTPYFGWLIIQANPQFGGLENNIPDGYSLRVPFPLDTSLLDYKNQLDNYFFYYGR